MSAASFLHSSFLQAIDAVMLWPVHVEKVPQASEHICPTKLQTRCDICCACQSICPFIFTRGWGWVEGGGGADRLASTGDITPSSMFNSTSWDCSVARWSSVGTVWWSAGPVLELSGGQLVQCWNCLVVSWSSVGTVRWSAGPVLELFGGQLVQCWNCSVVSWSSVGTVWWSAGPVLELSGGQLVQCWDCSVVSWSSVGTV